MSESVEDEALVTAVLEGTQRVSRVLLSDHLVSKAAVLATPFQFGPSPFEKLKGTFVVADMKFDGMRACFALRGFILSAPFQISATSDARYHAVREVGEVFELLQYLPPWSRTSHHRHEETDESFLPLVGTCVIGTDGREHYLRGGQRNFRGSAHYLRTEDEGAWNLICVRGSDPRLRRDHVHLPFPKEIAAKYPTAPAR